MHKKKTEECLKISAQPESNNSVQEENIKITGTEEGIALIEKMFQEMEASGDIEIISESGLLNNKGESRKRKFLEVNVKNMEE